MLTVLTWEKDTDNHVITNEIRRYMWGRTLRVLDGHLRRRVFHDIFTNSRNPFPELARSLCDGLESL